MGIIEQWGNGLKLIAEDLANYPGIELSWKEPGIAFRVTFKIKEYKLQPELQLELQPELQYELQHESLFSKVLRLLLENPLSRKEISIKLGQKSISGQLNEVLKNLKDKKLIDWTIKDKPQSSKQQLQISQNGIIFLKLLEKKKD